jgi:hypothetical protein
VDEVAAGVTDLLLGAVLVVSAWRLGRTPGVHRYWALMFWFAAAGAFAGTAHHLLFRGSRAASDRSWLAVGVLVIIAISYMLAATATDLLDERLARLFIRLRIAGLVAYVVLIATMGIGRTKPLVLSESLTMAAIVGLWFYALYVGRPAAGRMLTAIAVCALSAIFFLLPTEVLPTSVGLDARSLQHLAQIPGVLLICHVIAWAASPRPSDDRGGVDRRRAGPGWVARLTAKDG